MEKRLFDTPANAKKIIKVSRKSFQRVYLMGRYNHSLSLDATVMVSKNCPTIGEQQQQLFISDK